MAVVGARVKLSSSVKRELKLAQGDEKWLNSLPISYLRKYAGKYVAVKDRKIVAASSTMKALYEKLDNLQVGMVVITRIEEPAVVIYFELF